MAHSFDPEVELGFEKNFSDASAILRAIAHPLRLKILNHISQNRKVNVHSIYSSLFLDQSITSQQLRILRDVKVVVTQRAGKEIYYSINIERLKTIATVLEKYFDTTV
jgi:ArsR family transcriptional regulator